MALDKAEGTGAAVVKAAGVVKVEVDREAAINLVQDRVVTVSAQPAVRKFPM